MASFNELLFETISLLVPQHDTISDPVIIYNFCAWPWQGFELFSAL